jgi:hypothetical protein
MNRQATVIKQRKERPNASPFFILFFKYVNKKLLIKREGIIESTTLILTILPISSSNIME